jgi:hypothetical protein
MLFSATPVFGQQAYALEFNQANNRFDIINLLTGDFTQLGSEGGTLFNDIAATPGGALYGIIHSTSFVILNANNGAAMSSFNFNVSGIESLAVAPDGTLKAPPKVPLHDQSRQRRCHPGRQLQQRQAVLSRRVARRKYCGKNGTICVIAVSKIVPSAQPTGATRHASLSFMSIWGQNLCVFASRVKIRWKYFTNRLAGGAGAD